nr:Fic family protein [Pseudoxanthomonas sp.]
MKLPVPAPQIQDLVASHSEDFLSLVSLPIGPDQNGEYEHWDKIRHRPPPFGLASDAWWLAIKLKRQALARPLPLGDKAGKEWLVSVTDSMQRRLHFIDREAAGSIKGMDGSGGQERFLIRSLIEEAMTSSQLEGAATTRAVAKEMLSTGRQPRDQSERMIHNNYIAMNHVRERVGTPITRDAILELHSILTDGTLEEGRDCGRFRIAEDNVVIYDRGTPPTLLHVPPPASEIEERIERICNFANDGNEAAFIHPVVRAIAIHFQIGYDHPFVDGNGRTARMLFYWTMLNAGYWMTEYLSISSVLNKAPGRYMRAYLYTESDGRDLSYFVSQQLETIEKAVRGLHAYIARKHSEDTAARQVLRGAKIGEITLNHRQRALLANALKNPEQAYTVASHQAAHVITYPTALNDLNDLVGANFLLRHRVGKYNEYYPPHDLRARLKVK